MHCIKHSCADAHRKSAALEGAMYKTFYEATKNENLPLCEHLPSRWCIWNAARELRFAVEFHSWPADTKKNSPYKDLCQSRRLRDLLTCTRTFVEFINCLRGLKYSTKRWKNVAYSCVVRAEIYGNPSRNLSGYSNLGIGNKLQMI